MNNDFDLNEFISAMEDFTSEPYAKADLKPGSFEVNTRRLGKLVIPDTPVEVIGYGYVVKLPIDGTNHPFPIWIQSHDAKENTPPSIGENKLLVDAVDNYFCQWTAPRLFNSIFYNAYLQLPMYEPIGIYCGVILNSGNAVLADVSVKISDTKTSHVLIATYGAYTDITQVGGITEFTTKVDAKNNFVNGVSSDISKIDAAIANKHYCTNIGGKLKFHN